MSRWKRQAADLAALALDKALKVAGDDGRRYVANTVYERVASERFTVNKVEYLPVPGSVGQTPHGAITGRSAARMVRERDLSGLRVLDMCCGVGMVGFTMLAELAGEDRVQSLTFADINVFNIMSVRRTLANGAKAQFGSTSIDTVIGDGFGCIEPAHQYDVIVSNPPHFDTAPFEDTDGTLNPGILGSYDPKWQFHRDIYSRADEFLSPRGEIWFLENRIGDPEQELVELIGENERLEVVQIFDDFEDPKVFWMISRGRGNDRAGLAAP